jgi:hypothetical protein
MANVAILSILLYVSKRGWAEGKVHKPQVFAHSSFTSIVAFFTSFESVHKSPNHE